MPIAFLFASCVHIYSLNKAIKTFNTLLAGGTVFERNFLQ